MAKGVQIHRFRDHAAVYSDGTVYLDAKTARKLAAGLYKIARSIESEKFVDSPPLTLSLEAVDHA